MNSQAQNLFSALWGLFWVVMISVIVFRITRDLINRYTAAVNKRATAIVAHRRAVAGARGAAAAGAAAGLGAGAAYLMSGDDDHHSSKTTEINPANGLPMIGGIGGVDVAGNSYGTNSNDDSGIIYSDTTDTGHSFDFDHHDSGSMFDNSFDHGSSFGSGSMFDD